MRISDWSSDVCSSDLLDIEIGATFGAEPCERTIEHRLGGRDELNDDAFAAREVRLDGRDQRRQLHCDEDLTEEALLRRFEDRDGGALGSAVQSYCREGDDDTGRFERRAEISVGDRTGTGIGVIEVGSG